MVKNPLKKHSRMHILSQMIFRKIKIFGDLMWTDSVGRQV